MSNLPDTTAAPSVIEIDGKEYRMRPLTDGDWGELERWMQDRYIDSVEHQIDRQRSRMTAEEITQIRRDAMRDAQRITAFSPQGLQMQMSFPGLVKMFTLSLRHDHEDITRDQVSKWMNDPDKKKQFQSRFLRINGADDDSEDDSEKKGGTETTETPVGNEKTEGESTNS